jgi:hypothetical protein
MVDTSSIYRNHHFVGGLIAQFITICSRILVGLWTVVMAMIVPMAHAETPTDYSGEIPANLRGPFIFEPDVVVALDCAGHDPCDGPLNFRKLIEAKTQKYESVGHKNPFLLKITTEIQTTLVADLKAITAHAHAEKSQLHPEFLTDAGSRIELVGVINRMDRQFITDASLTPAQQDCGEIAVIYRFSYDLGTLRKSRLPVTMNIVFPALPKNTKGGTVTCQSIAARWIAELKRPIGRTPQQKLVDLVDEASGPLGLIKGEDMLRIEINAQVYRKPAAAVQDFGSEAEYLIRVFHWEEKAEAFQAIGLTNEIDRDKMICKPTDSTAACKQKKSLRAELIAYLQEPATVADIDAGTLELPEKFLAKRAISVSPGGVHRARNQPFWKPTSNTHDAERQNILSDDEIERALKRFDDAGEKLSYIKSAEDFRTRLNDSTCTGCHQTRAIAGFHFPGADRKGTPAANSVFLPGSPLFYGDQPRRLNILNVIAQRPSGKLTTYELAIGYSARPLNKLSKELSGTELLGGWGGACIMPEYLSSTKREWTCRDGLVCKQFSRSQNEKLVGTCVPKAFSEVGDPIQQGEVTSTSYEEDAYERISPKPYASGDDHNKLIDAKALKELSLQPLAANTYYGAHQEYFGGKDCSNVPCTKTERRDSQTGGFPSGMLRLSECLEMGVNNTCGLIASSGFNACLDRLTKAGGAYTLDTCFLNFTSFAAMRACDASLPCRDDYICVSPVARGKVGFDEYFESRKWSLENKKYFKDIVGKKYDASDYFGQDYPEKSWFDRYDRRGICIPPYFVFQFRSDKHPKP